MSFISHNEHKERGSIELIASALALAIFVGALGLESIKPGTLELNELSAILIGSGVTMGAMGFSAALNRARCAEHG
jgi:hypothetical protein